MAMWSAWRGCQKHSEGCKYCYVHQGDIKRGIDTNTIIKLPSFDAPVRKNKNGEYRIKSGQTVYMCFQTDFLIADADQWRNECWNIIRERNDLHFIFLTKRIERFMDCVPNDWGNGWNNITVGVSIENQDKADFRLDIFSKLPIKYKNIILQPLIENVDIEKYLNDIELVIVGGEYGKKARPLNFDWVLDIREQCKRNSIPFEFRQCGTHFIKDGKTYTLAYNQLSRQAKLANINLPRK
jgi:Bacteriophage protein gp37